MSDILGYWGTGDFAVQIFVKQRHMRPYIYRYYVKNGNVAKAVSINNQENMTKETRLYQSMIAMIQEHRTKPTGEKIRSKSQYNHRRDALLARP